MSKVIFDISISLDGFMTAANRRPDESLGDGGQQLHQWAFGEDNRGSQLLKDAVTGLGAVVAGRRTYDTSLPGWGQMGQPVSLGDRYSLSRMMSHKSRPKGAYTRS